MLNPRSSEIFGMAVMSDEILNVAMNCAIQKSANRENLRALDCTGATKAGAASGDDMPMVWRNH